MGNGRQEAGWDRDGDENAERRHDGNGQRWCARETRDGDGEWDADVGHRMGGGGGRRTPAWGGDGDRGVGHRMGPGMGNGTETEDVRWGRGRGRKTQDAGCGLGWRLGQGARDGEWDRDRDACKTREWDGGWDADTGREMETGTGTQDAEWGVGRRRQLRMRGAG